MNPAIPGVSPEVPDLIRERRETEIAIPRIPLNLIRLAPA